MTRAVKGEKMVLSDAQAALGRVYLHLPELETSPLARPTPDQRLELRHFIHQRLETLREAEKVGGETFNYWKAIVSEFGGDGAALLGMALTPQRAKDAFGKVLGNSERVDTFQAILYGSLMGNMATQEFVVGNGGTPLSDRLLGKAISGAIMMGAMDFVEKHTPLGAPIEALREFSEKWLARGLSPLMGDDKGNKLAHDWRGLPYIFLVFDTIGAKVNEVVQRAVTEWRHPELMPELYPDKTRKKLEGLYERLEKKIRHSETLQAKPLEQRSEKETAYLTGVEERLEKLAGEIYRLECHGARATAQLSPL